MSAWIHFHLLELTGPRTERWNQATGTYFKNLQWSPVILFVSPQVLFSFCLFYFWWRVNGFMVFTVQCEASGVFFIWNILTCRKSIFVFICIAWWKFLSVWLLSPMLSYISRSSCLWTPAAAAASLHSAAELSLWHTNVWTCPSFSLPMKILTSSAFLLLLSPMHTSSLPGSFPPASVAAVADLLTLTKTQVCYVTFMSHYKMLRAFLSWILTVRRL